MAQPKAERLAKVRALFDREQQGAMAPRRRADIPGSPDALTREWLTDVLCPGVPNAAVTGFALGPAGMAPRFSGRTIAVTYNEAGSAAGLPVHLFSKSLPYFWSRFEIGLSGLSAAEVVFYRDIRPNLMIEAPSCYYAGFDEESFRVFLLLDDVSRARGATFHTALDLVVGRELAERIVTQMARVHAPYWGRTDGLAELRDVREAQIETNAAWEWEATSLRGFELSEQVVPAAVYARRNEWHEAYMRSIDLNVAGPQTLVHKDTHIGNWYLADDGEPGLVDWQTAARGGWAIDLVYALSTALAPADRRAWEQDLLRLYLDELGRGRADPPDFEAAWLNYRQQAFHACASWVVTLGFYEPPVPADITMLNVERTARAVHELDSFGALEG